MFFVAGGNRAKNMPENAVFRAPVGYVMQATKPAKTQGALPFFPAQIKTLPSNSGVE